MEYTIQVVEGEKQILMVQDGVTSTVPIEESNRHYQMLLEEFGQQFLDDIENA